MKYWSCSFLFCFFQAAEFIDNKGIIFEGQTWMFEGCTFYFPGVRNSEYCPSMTRPVCYVYNGAICCASECSGIACFCLSWLAHAWSNPSLVYSFMRCTSRGGVLIMLNKLTSRWFQLSLPVTSRGPLLRYILPCYYSHLSKYRGKVSSARRVNFRGDF